MFKALGWNVLTIDGNDTPQVDGAIMEAKSTKNGKPTVIIAKTVIGKGIPEVEGTNAAHGEAGVAFQDSSRKGLDLPDEKFFVSPETTKFFEGRQAELKGQYDAWTEKFAAWKAANPALAKELAAAV